MSEQGIFYRDNKHLFGARVDLHCPYDETQLREDKQAVDHNICPCCWSSFPAGEQP